MFVKLLAKVDQLPSVALDDGALLFDHDFVLVIGVDFPLVGLLDGDFHDVETHYQVLHVRVLADAIKLHGHVLALNRGGELPEVVVQEESKVVDVFSLQRYPPHDSVVVDPYIDLSAEGVQKRADVVQQELGAQILQLLEFDVDVFVHVDLLSIDEPS